MEDDGSADTDTNKQIFVRVSDTTKKTRRMKNVRNCC